VLAIIEEAFIPYDAIVLNIDNVAPKVVVKPFNILVDDLNNVVLFTVDELELYLIIYYSKDIFFYMFCVKG